MKKQNVRTLSLIVCTFTYLLVGAAIFDALESDYERNERSQVEEELNKFQKRYNISEDDMKILAYNVKLKEPHKAGHQWKFAGSFYFATTVITTIGYGHSTPRTDGGKAFCMFYALAGIPLTLVMFQSVGERLNTIVTFLLENIKKCFKFKDTKITQTNLIFVSINLSGSVIMGGAYIFSSLEGWGYFDAFYYCFITLTTVGFGDYVALQKRNSLDEAPAYVAFGLGFIWFGLTVLAAAMNLLVLRLLTLNTEDEKRDELEAARRARNAVRLDGDIIMTTTGNGTLAAPMEPCPGDGFDDDALSVCSCTCYDFGKKKRFLRRQSSVSASTHNSPTRYKATRPPSRVTHLLNRHTHCSSHSMRSEDSQDCDSSSDDTHSDDELPARTVTTAADISNRAASSEEIGHLKRTLRTTPLPDYIKNFPLNHGISNANSDRDRDATADRRALTQSCENQRRSRHSAKVSGSRAATTKSELREPARSGIRMDDFSNNYYSAERLGRKARSAQDSGNTSPPPPVNATKQLIQNTHQGVTYLPKHASPDCDVERQGGLINTPNAASHSRGTQPTDSVFPTAPISSHKISGQSKSPLIQSSH